MAIRVLRPRTDLNGGERGQERDRQAKRQKEEVKDRPRTNLNGGELGQSTFLVLTFAFALAFISTFVLALILAFLSPFRGKVVTFLGWNREKRCLWIPCGIIPFGAFGRAFAFAHGIRSRVTGHWSAVKAGINSKRRRRRWCGRGCRGSGWRRHWGARRHANRAWAIWRGVRLRSVSGIRGEGGGVFPRGAGASGALILALEAAGCGRRAKACLGRFILRHSVAAASSALSFSGLRIVGLWVRYKSIALGSKGEQSGGCLEALFFFCSLLLRCDLLAKKVPGRALQSAYHDPQLDVTELKQHRTT